MNIVRVAALACALMCVAAIRPGVAHGSTLDSLAWMAGSWAAAVDSVGDRQEEHWMAPRGGLMVGMHRDVKAGRAGGFEFFRIEERADGVYYMTSPGGRPATPFKMKECSGHRVVFENLKHDFPTRIIYWQEHPYQLRARIEGDVKGKLEFMEWTWASARLTP